jgi:hypothetical protein
MTTVQAFNLGMSVQLIIFIFYFLAWELGKRSAERSMQSKAEREHCPKCRHKQ